MTEEKQRRRSVLRGALAVLAAAAIYEVMARSGYFALPPTDGAPLLPYEMPMLAAASTTPLPTPFRVGATTYRFGVTPRGVQHTVLVEVPLDALTFEEEAKGSLEPGKLAELVVLEEDILTCAPERIRDVAVALTMVGGRVVYRR